MKRLEISRLMDEYQDNEFFPEGAGAADAETVKDMVLAKAAPAEEKRRMPRFAQILLAAALAVGCVLMIAAGMSEYKFDLSNGLKFGYPGDDFEAVVRMPGGGGWPIVLEGDRLWLLVSESERIDVTNKIDENTPQIYPYADPDTEGSAFLVIGGTPEDFGWAVVIPRGEGTKHYGANGNFVEFSDEYDKETGEGGPWVYKPWYLAALDQLGLSH